MQLSQIFWKEEETKRLDFVWWKRRGPIGVTGSLRLQRGDLRFNFVNSSKDDQQWVAPCWMCINEIEVKGIAFEEVTLKPDSEMSHSWECWSCRNGIVIEKETEPMLKSLRKGWVSQLRWNSVCGSQVWGVRSSKLRTGLAKLFFSNYVIRVYHRIVEIYMPMYLLKT